VGRGTERGEEALSTADPFRFTTIAHQGRDLLGPVSGETVDAMIGELASALDAAGISQLRVLDVGCGKGEMLVRTLEVLGGRGVGVEPNPAFAADARARIVARMPADHAAIIEAELDQASLPDHTFTVVICAGALHAFGGWREALTGMRRLVASGGLALMGPGYWQQPPASEYLAAFGGEEGEQESLPRTLSAAEDAGWQVLACHESSDAEWEDYEQSYAAQVRAWCAAHADDLDAPAFRERIETWNAAYRRWGRTTMGYALLLLRRGD
jgi:ubiquinone/menaquinone biosynthesis C-methylase UbiE